MGAINDFQAQVSKADGLARLARYRVLLTPPVGADLPKEQTETLGLFCSSITMPGHDLQTSTVKHGTEINREMVVGHGYEGTIEATFYLDQELDLKSYLDSWQEAAISTTRNTVSYYEVDGVKQYVGSMQIFQLGSKSSLLVTQFSSRSASQKYSESPEPNPSPSESYQYSSAAGIKHPQPKSSMPLPAQIPQWSIISVSAFGFEQLGSGSIPLSTQYPNATSLRS